MWTEEQIQKAAYDYEGKYGGVVAAAFIAGAKYIINNTQKE